MKTIVLLMSSLLILAIINCNNNKSKTNPLDDQLIAELKSYILENHQTPEKYIISKFYDHDIVFVGERHRLRHDVKLIRDLIPLLYENGIYDLGIEFANFRQQGKIDSLIFAAEYDEDLARLIQFKQWPFWGYQDYIDIYKAAWKFNISLPEDARKFRVVGLNALMDWSYIWSEEDRNNPEIMKKAFPDGNGDKYMAKVILDEFVAKGDKALIYTGINHAYTRYHQPFQRDGKWKFVTNRMGNVVYNSIGNKCMTIFLHSPWWSKKSQGEYTFAVDTVIDKLMLYLEPKYIRAGFNVIGTPFENLTGESSWWSNGYKNFTLSDYCDGYIIQMPLHQYEGVSVAEGFFTEENRVAAASQSANPKTKDITRTVEELTHSIQRDTEIQRLFGFNGLDKPLEIK